MENLAKTTRELQDWRSALRSTIERKILAYPGAHEALKELTNQGAQKERIIDALILFNLAEQERLKREKRSREYKAGENVTQQLVKALHDTADQTEADNLLRPLLKETLARTCNLPLRDLKKKIEANKVPGERLDPYNILVKLPEILRVYARLLEISSKQISTLSKSLSGLDTLKYRAKLHEYVVSACKGKGIRENLTTLIDASNRVFAVKTSAAPETLKKYAQRHASRPPDT